jgi:hypothetical protein
MRPVALVGALLLWPTLVLSQQQRPPQCTTPDHHAFDFWVGEWEVSDTAGKVIATSSIQSQATGCAIMEHWMPIGQPDGVSISWLEPTDKKWHQRWVAPGWITSFTGGMSGAVMVLLDDRHTPPGSQTRMSYTPLADGRVKQTVETSTDGGVTWKIGFAGFYRRKG